MNNLRSTCNMTTVSYVRVRVEQRLRVSHQAECFTFSKACAALRCCTRPSRISSFTRSSFDVLRPGRKLDQSIRDGLLTLDWAHTAYQESLCTSGQGAQEPARKISQRGRVREQYSEELYRS